MGGAIKDFQLVTPFSPGRKGKGDEVKKIRNLK
jgi:hypothetical protein